ncbi:MAG: hypothetical protein ACRDRQ_06950 [Pseudonocardiaceae bacterium]
MGPGAPSVGRHSGKTMPAATVLLLEVTPDRVLGLVVRVVCHGLVGRWARYAAGRAAQLG